MLNKVLIALHEKYNFWDLLGQDKALEFLQDIKKIGYHYDCNDYEILDKVGMALGICFECYEKAETLSERGRCDKYTARLFGPKNFF